MSEKSPYPNSRIPKPFIAFALLALVSLVLVGCDGRAQEEAKPEHEDKSAQALELVMSTLDALIAERGEDEKIWGSMIKQTLKRQRPGSGS